MVADQELEIFEEIFSREPANINYQGHPSNRTLLQYITGNLDDGGVDLSEQHLDSLMTGYTDNWSRREVAAHVMTCQRCSTRVGRIKRWNKVLRPVNTIIGRLLSLLDDLNFATRKSFYAHLGAYGVAGLVLLLSFFVYRPSRIVLESTGDGTGRGLVFKIILGLVCAWGLWGLIGLGYHGYKSFYEESKDGDGE